MSSFTRATVLGSAAAVAAAFPMLGANASAAPKGDAAADVATLATQLAQARAAVKAYGDASATNVLGASVAAVIKEFGADHQAHADAIAAAITQAGGTPSPDAAAPVDIASLKTEGDVLAALYGLERTTAASYLAAIGELRNRDVAKSTGAILGVVTTHVALLAEALRRGQAYPTGFVTA